MTKKITAILASVLAVALSESAFAYVGPGAGLSLVGALWGLLVAVVAALGFIILWPIRRMRRQRSSTHSDAGNGSKRDREDRPIEDGAGREAS